MRPILVILVIVIGILVCYFIQSKDRYGQDPSIRASVGWIAGPNYGYDPITQFSEQIAEMERKIYERCHDICENKNSPECHKCVREAQI